MEYQLTEELSAFWRELVPPIFLLSLSIICFLWVIGKDNRRKAIKFLLEDKSNQSIEENGILIPKTATLEYAFFRKLLSYTGLESIKPIVALFLFFLLFYGIGRIIFFLAPSPLVIVHSGVLFASGVSDEIIAEIWMHYPNASYFDLYGIIKEITEASTSYPITFWDKVCDFIQFDLICCFILLFSLFKNKKINADKKVYCRLFLFICILLLLHYSMLLIKIHQNNEEVLQLCYKAHSMLLKEKGVTYLDFSYNKEYQEFLDRIQEHKQERCDLLFYGAYEIRYHYIETFVDFITDISQEFFRFLNQLIVQVIN